VSSDDEKKVKRTARVKRGLNRAFAVIVADLETIRGEYHAHGMTKAALDDYELAVQWIYQQSR
jgi:hypothetical protein